MNPRPIHVPDPKPLVTALHDSSAMLCLMATGAFTGLAHRIWGVPGSSRTILDAHTPYARSATIAALGKDPVKFCTAETARSLAEKAYENAVAIAAADREQIPFAPRLFGLGGAAALATGREKRGGDRFHLVIRGPEKRYLFSAKFKPGLTRDEQDQVADTIALALIAHAASLEPIRLREYADLLETEHLRAVSPLSFVVAPHEDDIEDERFEELLAKPVFMSDGARHGASFFITVAWRPAFLCGSFKPVHEGHLGMAQAVRESGHYEPVFVIEVQHPDKGRLSYDEVMARVEQFRWKGIVMVTSGQGLFIEKARRFPETPFVLGADTAQRLLDAEYYGGAAQRDAVLDEFASLGTTFLVAGREIDGVFVTLGDLPIAERHRALFVHVEFRKNISSTEIRRRQAG